LLGLQSAFGEDPIRSIWGICIFGGLALRVFLNGDDEILIKLIDMLRLGWAVGRRALDLRQFRRSGILGHN
jgi:hypothetical protein